MKKSLNGYLIVHVMEAYKQKEKQNVVMEEENNEINEEEILAFVSQMKDIVFETHESKEDIVEGEIRPKIFKMITEGFTSETMTMTNVEFERLLTETIARLTEHLLEEISSLPEKLAIRFSYDVVSQVIVASYQPDEEDKNRFDPMFG